MVWRVFGAPGGLLGRVLGPCGLQDEKKWRTSDSFDPPLAPKLEPKSVKNRNVGAPEGIFVDQSVNLEAIFEDSRFQPVF